MQKYWVFDKVIFGPFENCRLHNDAMKRQLPQHTEHMLNKILDIMSKTAFNYLVVMRHMWGPHGVVWAIWAESFS
jgi:hypothetical protein